MKCFQVGWHVRPCDGQAVSGDAVVVRELVDGVFLGLVDALGHGRAAADVALRAIRFLKQNASPEIAAVLQGLHDYLRGTRGAVASLAFAAETNRSVTCGGIGNVVVRCVGQRDQRYASPDGVVGLRTRMPRISQFALHDDELLLMYTDGVAENFAISPAAALFRQSADAIARRVVLDHGKLYDDAACIALRCQP